MASEQLIDLPLGYSVDVPASGAMRGMKVGIRLTGKHRMAARIWVGAHLFRFAAWIIGCEVEIDTRTNNERRGMTGHAGIPARMSVDSTDFDYRIGRRLRIMLDGVEMQDVTAYDIEAGTITRHRHGADGRLVILRKGELAQETLRGVVEVEWKDAV